MIVTRLLVTVVWVYKIYYVTKPPLALHCYGNAKLSHNSFVKLPSYVIKHWFESDLLDFVPSYTRQFIETHRCDFSVTFFDESIYSAPSFCILRRNHLILKKGCPNLMSAQFMILCWYMLSCISIVSQGTWLKFLLFLLSYKHFVTL